MDEDLALALALSLADTDQTFETVEMCDKKRGNLSIKDDPVGATSAVLEKEQATNGSTISKVVVPCFNKLFHSSQHADMIVHKKRLAKRLKELNLVSLEMPSDGNCQFSSISDQLFGSWKEHKEIRENVIRQLIDRQDLYIPFIPANFDLYCTHMSNNSWGDNVTAQAAADYYGVQINMITSNKADILVQIFPQRLKSSRILWLSYVGRVHFNSLYTTEEWENRKSQKKQKSNSFLSSLPF